MQAMTDQTRLRHDPLPASLPPRGLRREAAAAYIGVSPATFDTMVDDGRMPSPKAINARRVWDRHKLDEAFDELTEAEREKSGATARATANSAAKPLAAALDDLPGWEDVGEN
jgi:predicted DNA-binding transcriptional regulator AlpA